jgi:hypothetical protein
MTGRMPRLAMLAIACSLLLVAGCPTSSEGIDLTTQGVLSLAITRTSEAATATATAVVTNNSVASITQSKIKLGTDQVLSVNTVPLTATALTSLGVDATVAATVTAVAAPATYAIQFDNQGTTSSCAVAPPEDFAAVTPAAGTTVPRAGFTIAWAPSGESDVIVGVTITGYILTYAQNGTLQETQTSVSLADVPDIGTAMVGATQLASFIAGNITVRMTRQRTVSQPLGFATGTIRLNIVRDIPLTLVETVATTGTM